MHGLISGIKTKNDGKTIKEAIGENTTVSIIKDFDKKCMHSVRHTVMVVKCCMMHLA